METWKPIKGFEGLYEVSDEGRVRSVDRDIVSDKRSIMHIKGRLRKYRIDHKGYQIVSLCKDGKHCNKKIHRLVYEAFVGEISQGMQVNHINEVKTDNRLCNLNLMTSKENINWGTCVQRAAAKNSKPVYGYDIDGNLIVSFPSSKEADKNGYNSGAVCAACKHKFYKIGNNKYKGLYWSYQKMGG